MKPASVILSFAFLTLGSCSSGWIGDYRPDNTTFPHREYVLTDSMHRGLFLAETYMDDSGPFNVLLDSGIYGIRLDKNTAHEIREQRLKEEGSRSTNVIETMRIGDWVASELMFEVEDLAPISRALNYQVDGVIGLSPFYDGLIIFDYRLGEVRVRKGRLAINDLNTIRYKYDDVFRPTIPYRIGRQQGRLMIDTGALAGILLESEEGIEWLSQPKHVGHVMTISGPAKLSIGQASGTIRLSHLAIDHPQIGIRDGVSVLGVDVLREYVITFDQQKRLVQFVPFHHSTD